jgi:hypothetical protein
MCGFDDTRHTIIGGPQSCCGASCCGPHRPECKNATESDKEFWRRMHEHTREKFKDVLAKMKEAKLGKDRR